MLLKTNFLRCAPSPAEVVACELKAIRANSEEHDCMGSRAASRPIVAGTTRLISQATYTRSDTFRLPQAGAQNFGAVRRQRRESGCSTETSFQLKDDQDTQTPDSKSGLTGSLYSLC